MYDDNNTQVVKGSHCNEVVKKVDVDGHDVVVNVDVDGHDVVAKVNLIHSLFD
jgi:hypothetical protein